MGNLAEDLPVLIATKTVFVENDPCVNFASLDVVSHADWRQLGEASLRPAHVRMRNATGDDMGVTSSTSVRGWCDDKLVEMTAPVTTRGTRNMGSSWKLLSFGNEVEMKPTHSALHHRNSGSVLLRRSGIRDFLVIRVAKSSEASTTTISTMKR